MKFAEKLSLALTLLLAALLTVYTVWTQDRQFSADLRAAAAQARAAWEQERYAMQTTLESGGDVNRLGVRLPGQPQAARPQGWPYTKTARAQYSTLPAALGLDELAKAPGRQRPAADHAGARRTRNAGAAGGGHGHPAGRRADAGARANTGRCVGGARRARLAHGAGGPKRPCWRWRRCCAGICAAAWTRPLAQLEAASREIAAGDYARRTALHTGDELESLSASFDEMAGAVQEKIEALENSVRARDDFGRRVHTMS